MKTNQTLQRIALPMLIFLSLFANALGNTHAYHAFHQNTLPDSIPIASRKNFHIQGIAMDKEHHYFYVSYTTQLVKYDLNGKEVGSVDNLLGHLGCIAYNPKDGKVYGSLEYKNDEIGRGISNKSTGHRQSATQFYVAVFEVDKITRPAMDGAADGVMHTVCLPTVKQLYEGSANINGKAVKHVYGCSGIDGLTFGPKFGQRKGALYLTVALGIYRDTLRTDNDYQVLLQYPWPDINRYARTLNLENMHTSGPAKPAATYFAYTGNTTYGVQNLEYDAWSDQWFLAVYKGVKKLFPNYTLFAIDNATKPALEKLRGHGGATGLVVKLSKQGLHDADSGVYGWMFPLGSMGMQSMGNGLFYFFHPKNKKANVFGGWLELYRYKQGSNQPFVRE